MKCTILGCGGSLGVPQLLCECYICKSGDSRNKRFRSSIFIESETTKILIDTSPDFKAQAFRNNISKIDAVLYTHTHSDHISGVDDLKVFAQKTQNKIPAYMDAKTYEGIRGTYSYLFDNGSSVYRPILDCTIIDEYSNFTVGDIQITSLLQKHGEMNSLGFRFGNLAYSTDFNYLSEKSLKVLEGVDIWIVDCLRYSWAPTHVVYESTLEYIEQVKPKRAILTHMAHDIDYEELKRILPPYVEPAFDGMTISW
ncbi:MAG: metal-dependent hydrolase of the beta-lactamase superfamily [Candidatus Midichloriaceae bacterium]|jgi:phosphoribosyl 1,2-cyclic phosphate phosphodiesterase|nr:metal-dependent hydrolase of the beta-lactamase superfamily [Candidatus Midichloriaceae bacterium]